MSQETQNKEFRPLPKDEIWQTLVSEPGIAVGIVTIDGLILFANEQVARMYGHHSTEDLIGRTFHETFPPPWADERVALIRRVIESDTTITVRTIWNGRQIRSTYRSIESGDDDEKRVLIISHQGSVGQADTGEVFESEVVNFGELEVLTTKELEVLALLGQGLRLKEIASALHRSPKTIDNHRTSIGRKLKLTDRVDLAQVAAEAGLEIRDAKRKRVGQRSVPSSSE